MIHFKHGDVCRTKGGAPARYWDKGLALYISSMSNDLSVSEAMPPTGYEDLLPLPSDEQLEGFSVGYCHARLHVNTLEAENVE